tara:strand:- start:7118 stop:8791 length:1674 start_codon:yes stop_codon:yes gene_type:complete
MFKMLLLKLKSISTISFTKAIFGFYVLFAIHIPISHIGGSGLYLPFNILSWIFASLIIGLGSWKIFKSRKLFFSQFILHSWIGFALIILPLAYENNDHSKFSLFRIIGLGVGVLLLISYHQFRFRKNDIHDFLYMFLGLLFIQSMFKLFQQFNPDLSFSLIQSIAYFGPFAQKNIFATYLSTGLIISFILLIIDETVWSVGWKRLLVHSVPLITMSQYFFLESRTGYLSIILSMGLIIVINYQKLKRAKVWFALAFLGLLIGFISQQESRPTGAIEYSKNSRMTTYLLTLELIKKNPVIGIGYGKFLNSFREHYAERKSTDPKIQLLGNNNMDHPHNEILFWMVEGGIAPLLGILFIVGSFLNIVWKAKKNIAWSQLILLLPITIHLQLELPFYISTIHWFTFIFLTFIIDTEHGTEYEIGINARSFFRVFSIMFPLIVCTYMLTTLQTMSLISKYERTGYKDPFLLASGLNFHALQKKYETLVMKLNLETGKLTKDENKIKAYIQWAENYVQHSPYLFVYYDLATAYESLGNREKAWDIYRYSKHLYPGAKWRDEN